MNMEDKQKKKMGRPRKSGDELLSTTVRVSPTEKPLVERFLQIVRESNETLSVDDLQCYCNK
jgi:hypothetical protein